MSVAQTLDQALKIAFIRHQRQVDFGWRRWVKRSDGHAAARTRLQYRGTQRL